MLGFTYTAFLPDPESTSPPQADNRIKIMAMRMLRGFMDTVMMSDGIEVCTVFILVFLLNYFQVTTSFVL